MTFTNHNCYQNIRKDLTYALIAQESTTYSTLIHGVYPGSEIKFGTTLSKSNAIGQGIGTEYLTIIDTNSKLCVYHPFNILLPVRTAGYWFVHDMLLLMLENLLPMTSQ